MILYLILYLILYVILYVILYGFQLITLFDVNYDSLHSCIYHHHSLTLYLIITLFWHSNRYATIIPPSYTYRIHQLVLYINSVQKKLFFFNTIKYTLDLLHTSIAKKSSEKKMYWNIGFVWIRTLQGTL